MNGLPVYNPWAEPIFAPEEESVWDRAAKRVRYSVKPEDGRREGMATAALGALGQIPMQMAGNVKNMMDAAYSHQMGTSVRDNPQYTGLVAENAMNVVGMPALTGGVPASALGSAAKGIRAYHGSPHDFDRFDLSKIGTGEGAQAYGHGLYFAENEGVARQYRDTLSDLKDRNIPGTDLRLPSWVAKRVGDGNPAQIAEMRADFQGRLAEMKRQIADPNTMQPWNIEANIPGIENILKALDEVERGATLAPAGRMYEVNINAKPEQFLDWDRPLREQPGVVQDLARNADLSHLKEGNRTRVMLEKFRAGEEQPHYLATGHTLHDALEDYGMKPRPELSAYLKDQGIPGVKYLDQGSRGNKYWVARHPQGGTVEYPSEAEALAYIARNPEYKLERPNISSNYVLFRDDIIEILKKYGLAGGIFGGLASGNDAQAAQ